jgi:hypothetical protein
VNAGDTFDCQLDPYHLWVIARKCRHDRVLVVTMTSPGRGKETLCQIEAGEHPRATHDSLINYSESGIGSVSDIVDALMRGDLIANVGMADEVVARICDVVPASRAPRRVKQFMTENCCPDPE